jgi:hypothetical protein
MVSLSLLGAGLATDVNALTNDYQECACGRYQLTPADSILFYRLLLDRIGLAIVNEAWRVCNKNFQECDQVLRDIEKQLSEIKKIVLTRKGLTQSKLGGLIESLESKYQVAAEQHASSLDPRLVQTLFAGDSAYVAWIRELALNCDPDPDGDLIKRIQKMIDLITTYNQSLQAYKVSCNEFSSKNVEIQEQLRQLGLKMDLAGQNIVIASQTGNTQERDAYLGKARTLLTSVAGQLKLIPPLADDTTKDILVSLLEAIVEMLGTGKTAFFKPVVFTSSTNQVPGILFEGGSAAKLMEEVWKVVRDKSYFQPGTPTQMWDCIAICWVAWWKWEKVEERERLSVRTCSECRASSEIRCRRLRAGLRP